MFAVACVVAMHHLHDSITLGESRRAREKETNNCESMTPQFLEDPSTWEGSTQQVGRPSSLLKTRPEGREGGVSRRLNELTQRLLHPGRERGRLPVLTPTTMAAGKKKKATPMQECECVCVCASSEVSDPNLQLVIFQ